MEKKNENGDAPDQDENAQMDENAQNPESPEIITLSSGDEDDEFDTNADESSPPDEEMDVDALMICLPSTSSDPSKSKQQQFDEVTFQVKKEFMEETSKTEVSSTKANHLDGNKASEYLAEVGKRLKNFQQQSSAASYAAESTSNSTTVTPSSQQQSHHQSSVSLPNSNDSQDLSEAENKRTEQKPSSWSTAASSADAYENNSTTVTSPNHSSVSSQHLSEAETVWREQQPSSWSSAASSADVFVSNSTVTAPNHSSVSSQDLSEGETVWREQQPSSWSSAASSADVFVSNSTVTAPNLSSVSSQDLSEGETVWREQQPSSWSSAASSADVFVSNSTVTAPNHSSVSSQAVLRVVLRNCDHDAAEMDAKVWREEARPVQAVPRVLLRNCHQDAMEMGAEVWRPEKIVWAPFGKNRSYWPGTIFQDFDIKKVNKPKHKFVLWFGSHNYSEIRKDRLLDFRQHFEEKFDHKASTKKKAVLEGLKILAEMSYLSQNSDLFDWGIRHFPGFQNRDEVLIQFLQPHLERIKQRTTYDTC